MEYFPPALETLIEQFARLPGVGKKSAQRLAFFVLGLPDDDAQAFSDAILDAKKSAVVLPRVRDSALFVPVPNGMTLPSV